MAIFDVYEDSFRLLTFQPLRPTPPVVEDAAAVPAPRVRREHGWFVEAVQRMRWHRAAVTE